MARVLLLKPNAAKGIVFEHTQPLGLMYVAASLRHDKRAHDVSIIDLRAERRQFSQVAERIEAFDADVFGISALTVEAAAAHALAADLRRTFPDRPIIVGGPHASCAWEAILADRHIDAAVIGEGEATTPELVRALGGAGPLESVAGIARRRRGNGVRTEARPAIEDLDSIPFPAWDLIPFEKYFGPFTISESKLRWHRRYVSMFSSRACPYDCIYCHRIFGKRFRARSTANVLAEIQTVVERYGVREIQFVDDTFNLDARRLMEICDHLVQHGPEVKISFPNGLRGDLLTSAQIDALRAAGTYHISFGIESGSQRLQTLMGKRANLAKLQAAIDHAAASGIFCHGFFMIGFPTETGADVDKTIRFAQRSRLHTAAFHQVVPFPGTEVARLAENRVKEVRPSSLDFSTPNVNLSAMGDEEIRRKVRRFYTKFYGNLSRLRRLMAVAPRKLDLVAPFFYFILRDRRLPFMRAIRNIGRARSKDDSQ